MNNRANPENRPNKETHMSAESGRRIGFIDYQLENFHANVYLQLLRNDLKDRGWMVAGCHALDAANGREWAAKNQVPWFDSPRTLNANVDAYVVLAPSNPEQHPDLCRLCFKFRKPVYVDKTFAPSLAAARRIFALADRYGVPVQTTSALRYTGVQGYAREVGAGAIRHMVAWGGGRSFGEYAIHPLELVISCMGPEVTGLMRRGAGDQSQLLLNFTEDRTAVVNVYANSSTPFAAAVTTAKETRLITVDTGAIFRDTASAILDMFESGKPAIDRRESLAIRQVLDVAGRPAALKKMVRLTVPA